MLKYTLPDNSVIDLHQVLRVGETFVNKNYSEYNSFEIYLTNGTSLGVFDNQLSREDFIAAWEAS